MSDTQLDVAGTPSTGQKLQYSAVTASVSASNLTTIAPYMFWLMFRNVASDGLVFEDPVNAGVLSQPGCVLASPSWEKTATHVNQDYVYNWTRDAAIVAVELAVGPLATNQPLIEYVQFAQACQNSASGIGHFDRASFLINGTPRDWTDQTDGPALQTLAILQLFSQLDAPTQTVANAVIAANLNFLQGAYQGETFNLWEEEFGASFFARSVQLKCFRGDHGQHPRDPGPGLAEHRHTVAPERPGKSLEWPVLPVDATRPDRLPRPLRPEHRHRLGGDLRRRPKSPTPSSWRPPRCCAASGPTRPR